MTSKTVCDRPLNNAQAEPVTKPLERAYAVAMMLAESTTIDGTLRDVADVIVDLLDDANRALQQLVVRPTGGEA